MSASRAAAAKKFRRLGTLQTLQGADWFIPHTHRVKVLDQVVLEDRRLEAVKHLVNLVSDQPHRFLMVTRSGKRSNQDRLLGVATKYPGVFQIRDEEYSLSDRTKYIDLTPEMAKLYRDELRMIATRDELLSVNIVRKLLMMAEGQEISLTKLSWLAPDFGLPRNFDTDWVYRYPKLFEVRETTRGPLLRLASWDQALTVTTREKTLLFTRSVPRNGFRLAQCPWREDKYEQFQEMEFRSPYEPWQKPNANNSSPVVQKRHLGVVHELLSLLPRKRIALPKLTLLRGEMQLPKTFGVCLVKHPGVVYVSSIVEPPVVFLREFFREHELKFKGPEDFIRDRYLILMQRKPIDDDEES